MGSSTFHTLHTFMDVGCTSKRWLSLTWMRDGKKRFATSQPRQALARMPSDKAWQGLWVPKHTATRDVNAAKLCLLWHRPLADQCPSGKNRSSRNLGCVASARFVASRNSPEQFKGCVPQFASSTHLRRTPACGSQRHIGKHGAASTQCLIFLYMCQLLKSDRVIESQKQIPDNAYVLIASTTFSRGFRKQWLHLCCTIVLHVMIWQNDAFKSNTRE